MNVNDIIGTYNIIGKNQEETEVTYSGVLDLSVDENSRVIAKWLINNTQEQLGTGFFKDNILVINFSYKGDDYKLYTGVVVYKCLTKDLLEGFWSEEYGDPNYLGEERCYRVTESKELN